MTDLKSEHLKNAHSKSAISSGNPRDVMDSLLESERRFRVLASHAPVGIFQTDIQGGCLYVNAAWCEVAALSPDEAMGQGWTKALHPDDRERVFQEWNAAAKSKKSFKSEYRFKTSEGQLTWLYGTAVPFRNDAGEIVGYLGTVVDITERKEAEERSFQATAKFEAVFNQSGIFAGIMDLEGRVLEINDLAVDWCGYTKEEVLGKPFWDTPWWRGSEETKTLIRAATKQAAAGNLFRETLRYWLADGSERVTDFAMHPIRDKSGAVRFLHPTGIDVTERKLAEAQLRLKEAQLQAITDTTPIMLVRCSRDLRYTFVNRAYADMLGFTPEDLIGKSFIEIVGEAAYEKIRRYIDEVLDGRAVDYEAEIPYKNIGVRSLRVAYRPDRDEQGDVRGWLASIRDVTEEKKAEIAQLRLAAIVESSTDAIVGKTLDGIVNAWNKGAERLFGYSAKEMIGRSITVLIPPDLQNEETMILSRISGGEAIEHYETIRMTKDGRLLNVSLSISPIKNDRGEVIGASKIARDITERKRADEMLRKSEERLRNFATELEEKVADRTRELTASNHELEAFCYSVSHDLRSPLRSIAGFSGLIMDEMGGHLNPEMKSYFDRILAASHRMSLLIDNLLQLSRLARQELKRDNVDLSEMAQSIAAELQRVQPERHVAFSIHPGLKAVGDPTLLRVVLQNLFENAWKFTSKVAEARIEFGMVEKEGVPVYFIRDNGAGFDMAHYKKLFGAFNRLHGEHEFPGTGIGLATVHRIIQRHGGSIWAEGRPQGGARFYFTLSVFNPEAAQKI